MTGAVLVVVAALVVGGAALVVAGALNTWRLWGRRPATWADGRDAVGRAVGHAQDEGRR